MTDPDFDLLAIGEPMGEFNATRGEPGTFRFGHGGDTSNAAIAAARQGARVAYWTRLGDDETGASFRTLWSAEGVHHADCPTDGDAPTGVYFVTHGPSGHSFSYLRKGSAASRMKPGQLPEALLRRSRVVFASGISLAISDSACDTVLAAFELARSSGVTVAFDTNLRLRLWPLARARALIEAASDLADIVRPSLDDATALTGLTAPDAVVDHYLGRGARIVALTMGADGALVATPERRERIARLAVEAVDATGAGDAFGGAFLAEWLRTADPFAAGRYANRVAAIATTGYGAVEPIPRRADLPPT